MPNENWVCFACRAVVRRGKKPGVVAAPACPHCRQPCCCIGMKTAVPTQSNAQGWRQLQAQLAGAADAVRERGNVLTARAKHDLEKRIAALEQLPPNKDRCRLIKSLRESLQRHNA